MGAIAKEVKKVSDEVFEVDVDATAEFFIIPNRACKLDDKTESGNARICRVNEFLDMNSFDRYDPTNDKVIQIWIVSEDDLDSNNIGDHGFYVTVPGIGIRFDKVGVSNTHFITKYIPEKCIRGMTEGESKIFKYRFKEDRVNTEGGSEVCVIVNLTLTLTANQQGYRYKSFGKFEDVLYHVSC